MTLPPTVPSTTPPGPRRRRRLHLAEQRAEQLAEAGHVGLHPARAVHDQHRRASGCAALAVHPREPGTCASESRRAGAARRRSPRLAPAHLRTRPGQPRRGRHGEVPVDHLAPPMLVMPSPYVAAPALGAPPTRFPPTCPAPSSQRPTRLTGDRPGRRPADEDLGPSATSTVQLAAIEGRPPAHHPADGVRRPVETRRPPAGGAQVGVGAGPARGGRGWWQVVEGGFGGGGIGGAFGHEGEGQQAAVQG